MTNTPGSKWPGREVRDPTLRAVAQSAVRQGWRYADHALYPPDGSAPIALPQTPQWHAAKRALAALRDRGLETVRPDYGAAPAEQSPRSTPADELSPEHPSALLQRMLTASVVRPDAQGNGRYSLAQARQMLRDGYGLGHVITTTGWGRLWLADLAERLATG